MAVKTNLSRFAVLKIEDDADDEVKSDKKNVGANAQKKKNKNKKKKPDNLKGEVSEKQWEEWQKHDVENVEKMYEQDLQQAILQSRIDFENKSNSTSKGGLGDINQKADGDKQKKKKDKPQPMSLQQFNQLPQQRTESESSNGPDSRVPVKPSTKVQEPDARFFDRVNEDAGRIVQKEKLQEEYQKQFLVETAKSRQHREELEKRDELIRDLQDKNQKFEEEMKVVKKRNQQLCHILAQGEMKDKTEVLAELAELTKVRDELTADVERLTMELEREKSQNHKMKAELDKLKGGKHVK